MNGIQLLVAKVEKYKQACELIVAVKHCMMFDSIHADFSVKEVLDKYGADTVQSLAKRATDAAEAALKFDAEQ